MKYRIPLFDLNFDTQEEDAVLETLRSRWISTGPKTEEFELMFADMLNVKYSVALTNCTVALHLALIQLGIGKGDEVICPSLTFVATVNAILYTGAKPVFTDIISNQEPTIDPGEIEKKITSKTKAIVVMHYGGFACNMDSIIAIVNTYNLKLIEDACHGPLSEYKGKKLGTIGDFGCFSFFSNKNISTGEGGMIVTNNKDSYSNIKLLRSHGMTTSSFNRSQGHSTSYDVVQLGYNYRMDDIRASIGIVQLLKLHEDLNKRKIIRDIYINRLSNNPKIIIPFENYKSFSSNYIFSIVLKSSTPTERDKIRKEMADAGIQSSIHYPAVHNFTIYKRYRTPLPITEYYSDNQITLPMYASLSNDQVNFICESLLKILS